MHRYQNNIICLGIDPGLSGAVALLGHGYLAVADMPVMGTGRQRLVNGAELTLRLRGWNPDIANIERAGAFPGQGVSSMFKFGRCLGVVEGILHGLTCPTEYVAASVWKRHFSLPKDKESSRMKALQLFPGLAQNLTRKKDENKAEALLIAHWFLTHRDTTNDNRSNIET